MDKEIAAKMIELVKLCEDKGASFVVGIAHDRGVRQAIGGEPVECIVLCGILMDEAEERQQSEDGSGPEPSPSELNVCPSSGRPTGATASQTPGSSS